MKITNGKQKLISVVVLGLLLMLAVPGSALGDKRRRGHNHDENNRPGKCGKFVNCHDARDGRVDGRGPRQSRVVNPLRNRDRDDSARNRIQGRDLVNHGIRRRALVRRSILR